MILYRYNNFYSTLTTANKISLQFYIMLIVSAWINDTSPFLRDTPLNKFLFLKASKKRDPTTCQSMHSHYAYFGHCKHN